MRLRACRRAWGCRVADDDNLFALGLSESICASGQPDVLETAAPTPPHPMAEVQQAYEQAFGLYEAAFEAFATADRSAGHVGYSCRISRSAVDYDELNRTAVRSVVERFTQKMLGGAASLDYEAEFARATGKSLHEALYPERDRRRRRHGDEEQDEPSVRFNLIVLWDSMARTYDDGGVWLARHQAATAIMSAWDLHRQAFDVKNGKAVIEQRVCSEAPTSYRSRRVHYNFAADVHNLCKALDVFFDYADLPGRAVPMLRDMSRHHEIEVESGATHVVAPGLVQVRTFNDRWKWTLRAETAERLREFIAAYLPPKQ